MKENRRPTTMSLLIFVFIAFFIGYGIGQSPAAPFHLFNNVTISADERSLLEPFFEVWDLTHTAYYKQPVDDEALVEGAIVGMLGSLEDAHTRYLSPEAQAAEQRSFSGEYQGIGAEVESNDGNITIVSPIDGSPAQTAELRPGDIIRQADGVDLTGMDISEAASLVRGPAGTAVTLLIEREGETFEIEIVRGVVQLVSATGEMLNEGLAYVRLSQFGNTTDEELEEVLADLMPQNPTGMILDLRHNPGGALDTTIEIADEFLDEGVVTVERFGDGRTRKFTSKDGGLVEDIPLAILIDEGSASASEVLAGAIQDRERAILIGQTSYGKGTVQTWHTLANNGGVRITIAQWLTPAETSINESGLTPDFFIPQPESEDGIDTQLQAAIDYLTGKEITSIPPETGSQ